MSMRRVHKIVVIQTAFLGDVVLTLPLVQVARQFFYPAQVDVVTTPRAAGLLYHHPDIGRIHEFDKRGTDSGLRGLLRVARRLQREKYDLALIPHRSLRSASLALLAGIPLRVGFKKIAGRLFYTKVVPYRKDSHEIERNLSLLQAFGIRPEEREFPRLHPSPEDSAGVDKLLLENEILDTQMMIGVAPGTVWKTKQWLPERFTSLVQRLVTDHCTVALVGGKEDEALCKEIGGNIIPSGRVVNAAGKLTLLQSAELLRRCRVLVTNDSAPMHMAVAVQTPVVAIFGATVPGFGFAPYGRHDVVVERPDLTCRPCSIHGGDKCPIKTFVCMKEISVDMVYRKVMSVLEETEIPR